MRAISWHRRNNLKIVQGNLSRQFGQNQQIRASDAPVQSLNGQNVGARLQQSKRCGKVIVVEYCRFRSIARRQRIPVQRGGRPEHLNESAVQVCGESVIILHPQRQCADPRCRHKNKRLTHVKRAVHIIALCANIRSNQRFIARATFIPDARCADRPVSIRRIRRRIPDRFQRAVGRDNHLNRIARRNQRHRFCMRRSSEKKSC